MIDSIFRPHNHMNNFDDDGNSTVGSRTPINSMPRGPHSGGGGNSRDELTVQLRHHAGGFQLVTLRHMDASILDVKSQYLEQISRMSGKEQQSLLGELLATRESIIAHAARRFAGVADAAHSGGGNNNSSSGGNRGDGGSSIFGTTHTTSTRFSGVLGKTFSFKNINPQDLTFATRDGHILGDGEKVAPLRRNDIPFIEMFVVPPVPHKPQEPLLVVSPLYPFPSSATSEQQAQRPVFIKEFDFASFIALATSKQQQHQNHPQSASPAAPASSDKTSPERDSNHSGASGANNNNANNNNNLNNNNFGDSTTSEPCTPIVTPSRGNSGKRAQTVLGAGVQQQPQQQKPLPQTITGELIVVREIHVPLPHSASAVSAAASSVGSASSGLPLPTAADLTRMSVASQQTVAAAACGDFIVHVHPEHTTLFEGAVNPAAAAFYAGVPRNAAAGSSSSSSPTPPAVVLNATSTQRKRTLPCCEAFCRVPSFYGTSLYHGNNSSAGGAGSGVSHLTSAAAAASPPVPRVATSGQLSEPAAAAATIAPPPATQPFEIQPVDRSVAFYAPNAWTPVNSWVSPDGNFVIAQLLPKDTDGSGGAGGGTFSAPTSPSISRCNSLVNLQQQQQQPQNLQSAGSNISNNSAGSSGRAGGRCSVFLVFESVSRGSAWVCRAALRMPLADLSISGWATEGRFVLGEGPSHCVIRVEPEGPLVVRCNTLQFPSTTVLGGSGNSPGDSHPPHHRRLVNLQLIRALPDYGDDTMLWYDPVLSTLRITHHGCGSNNSNAASAASPTASTSAVGNINSSPNSVTSGSASAEPFGGFALHLKRRHANPLLFGYVLQTRAPKWQMQSSSLPQFVISPSETGFTGICLEETSHPAPAASINNSNNNNNSSKTKSSNSSASAAAQSSSMATHFMKGGGVPNNSSFAFSSVSMATIGNAMSHDASVTQQLGAFSHGGGARTTTGNVQQNNSSASNNSSKDNSSQQSNQQQQQRPQPLAVHFLHKLHAAQTAPDPPDEALLLLFQFKLVYVSEHGGGDETFNISYVLPRILPGSIVAAQFSRPGASGATASSPAAPSPTTAAATGTPSAGPSRLRIVYTSESEEDDELATTIHVVTLQADWKAPVESSAGFLDFFKRKLSFLSRGSDDAASAAAKEAQKLAESSHKRLKLGGIDAFQHGACDCYMASAAPVGVVVKATGTGGIAVVRLRSKVF